MKLIVLDRDGVINFDSDHYIKSPAEWRPIPGSIEAIARLNQHGYRVAVATNQSGIGRGLFDMATFNAINDKDFPVLQGTFLVFSVAVILANLIPAAPFVILVMTPFIEQIDPNLESAARVFGASTGRMFVHVLVPLLGPGILAASLLVLVRTIALFELTFLTAGPDSQTLVVALYYAVFAAGVRAPQSVDAMAMIYMAVTLVWLLIALRFVNPTQLVSRVKEHPQTA